MSITLTINASSPSELQSTLAALAGSTQPAAKAETKTAAPKPAAEKAPAPPAVSTEEAPAPEADATGEVSDADLKKVAVAYQQKNGRDALASALKQFGAPAGVTSVPADKRAEFVAYCEA
jgi:hypothetical protein